MVKKIKSSKNRKPCKGHKSKSIKVLPNVIPDNELELIQTFCENRVSMRVELLKEIKSFMNTRDELQKQLDELTKLGNINPEQQEISDKLDRVKIQHGTKENELEATTETYYKTNRHEQIVKKMTNISLELNKLTVLLSSSGDDNAPSPASIEATDSLNKRVHKWQTKLDLEESKLRDEINLIIRAQSKVDMAKANKLSNEKYEEMVKTLTDIASKMWKDIKEKIKETPSFMEWEDKEKLDYFRDTLKYDEFMNEYPVMTRYMVCMGQYSKKAFTRFLTKIRVTKHPDKCEKGYKEDQWVQRQADYVQYLWEAYQKNHINSAERRMVWTDAYKSLKGEFDEFRDRYKSVEEATKVEKKELMAHNARDLIRRLADGDQTLSDEEMLSLRIKLIAKLRKKRMRDVLSELTSNTKQTKAACQGFGTGPEQEDETNKPRIVMTEHVAEDRMKTIPEELIKGIDADDMEKYVPIDTSMLPPIEDA
jgi:hypothetical protein